MIRKIIIYLITLAKDLWNVDEEALKLSEKLDDFYNAPSIMFKLQKKKKAIVIAEYFNYEDSSELIKISNEYHEVFPGWEEGFQLAGGIIEKSKDFKEFEKEKDYDKFVEAHNPVI